MDWCSYVLQSLVKECTGFNASNKFSGPLLLLVLIYVNSTVSKKVKVEKTIPTFKAWSSNLLLKRQQEELDLKGFGLLPIVKCLEFTEPKKVYVKKKLKSITEDEDETPEKVEQKEDFHYKTFERNELFVTLYKDSEELGNIIEKRNELFVSFYKDENKKVEEDNKDKDRDLEKDDDDEETDGEDDDDDAPDGDNDDKDDDETDGH
nr:ulp1 protease family, C-terminal catalytic domain-containing protein [Tanacetum cinerariifolium]